MKKLLAVASATLMLSSVAGVAVAHHDPDHDQNHRGMCTAYFSGSENGQEKKRERGNAFRTFEDTIGADNAEDVAAFCEDTVGSYGNPGQGNDPYFPDDEG